MHVMHCNRETPDSINNAVDKHLNRYFQDGGSKGTTRTEGAHHVCYQHPHKKAGPP